VKKVNDSSVESTEEATHEYAFMDMTDKENPNFRVCRYPSVINLLLIYHAYHALVRLLKMSRFENPWRRSVQDDTDLILFILRIQCQLAIYAIVTWLIVAT
jgi:hypothetical protein